MRISMMNIMSTMLKKYSLLYGKFDTIYELLFTNQVNNNDWIVSVSFLLFYIVTWNKKLIVAEKLFDF
jgi:hypothetical protein